MSFPFYAIFPIQISKKYSIVLCYITPGLSRPVLTAFQNKVKQFEVLPFQRWVRQRPQLPPLLSPRTPSRYSSAATVGTRRWCLRHTGSAQCMLGAGKGILGGILGGSLPAHSWNPAKNFPRSTSCQFSHCHRLPMKNFSNDIWLFWIR